MFFQLLTCLGGLLAYLVAAALCLLALRKWVKMPRELFRKALHLCAVSSVFVVLYGSPSWQVATLTCLLLVALIYPVLHLLERLPLYNQLLPQRNDGEIKKSLVIFFLMLAGLMALFQGLLQETNKLVIVVAVLAWGFGDAAAALVGKKFGKRKIAFSLADGKKTWAGTVAMFLVAFGVSLAALHHGLALSRGLRLLLAFVVGAVCAFVELISKGGWDTLTVPLAASVALYSLSHALALTEVA